MKTALSLGLSVMLAASGAPRLVAEAAAAVSAAEASDALWRATAFLQSISAGGGYLWHYSVDLQRRAGESMADANLIWIQPPGTPTVGQAYLRAYAATKQSRYLDAARSVAAALGRCQLESGGWHYSADMVQLEYNRDGALDYKGRAFARANPGKPINPLYTIATTFDDNNTQSVVRFLVAMVVVTRGSGDTRDQAIKSTLTRALDGMLRAQYRNGAWPEQYDGKLRDPAAHAPQSARIPADYPRVWPQAQDYTAGYTLNDGTQRDCVLTLLDAEEKLGDARCLAAAKRGGDFLVRAQLPAAATPPQPAAGEVVELSPFVVSTDSINGYTATQTLSGTRLRSEARDVGSAMTILTPEFLDDIGAIDITSAFDFVPSTETYRLSATDTDGNSSRSGNSSTVRGFQSSSLSLNFFTTNVRIDRYNTESFSFNRGPNSIFFGAGSPGGLIDAATKQAHFRGHQTKIEFRYNDAGPDAQRVTFDQNLSFKPQRFAVRVAALYQDGSTAQTPSRDDRRSLFLTATKQLFTRTTVRVNAEAGRTDRLPGRQYVVFVRYTPWVKAGRPLVNGTAAPANRTGLVATGANYLVKIEGTTLPVMNWAGLWRGTNPTVAGTARTDISFGDESLLPYMANVGGPKDLVHYDYQTYAAFVEQGIGDKFALEAAVQYVPALADVCRPGPLPRRPPGRHLRPSTGQVEHSGGELHRRRGRNVFTLEPNWRISANASRNITKSSNLIPEVVAYIATNHPMEGSDRGLPPAGRKRPG